MSSEPALKSEQEVVARFQEMRQNVSTLFSKLSDIEQGVARAIWTNTSLAQRYHPCCMYEAKRYQIASIACGQVWMVPARSDSSAMCGS